MFTITSLILTLTLLTPSTVHVRGWDGLVICRVVAGLQDPPLQGIVIQVG